MKNKRLHTNSGLAHFYDNEANKNSFLDDVIKANVHSSIYLYSRKLNDEITVAVNDGLVTLIGIVPWMYQKMVLASMIMNIEGVKGVINKIMVANRPI